MQLIFSNTYIRRRNAFNGSGLRATQQASCRTPCCSERTFNNLALAHAAAGDSDVARFLYEERIELAHRMADEEGEATAECNLGTLLKDCGKLQDALHHMERGLQIDRRNNNAKRECESLAAIGTVYFTLGTRQRH